jgi:hypothetical protein
VALITLKVCYSKINSLIPASPGLLFAHAVEAERKGLEGQTCILAYGRLEPCCFSSDARYVVLRSE